MRRTAVGFICCLLIAAPLNGASAKPGAGAGAELVRGASATWWRHNGNVGKLYFLDVYDSTGTYGSRPQTMRAYFGAIPCKVGRRDRARDCNWRQINIRRVKVDSFEIDPMMESAHAVFHSGDRRGEITWTGRGDYSRPFVWESFGQYVLPPYFASAHASVIAFFGRRASARGDMFGLDLQRNEFHGGGMGDIAFAGVTVCAGLPWC